MLANVYIRQEFQDYKKWEFFYSWKIIDVTRTFTLEKISMLIHISFDWSPKMFRTHCLDTVDQPIFDRAKKKKL